MYLNIKRGEYIILFAGEKNNELKQLVKDIGSNDINIVSKNAYIVSCLQSGTIIGNSFGKTTINIFEREKLIKKLRIIVLPRRKNKYPILVDRFNAVPRNFKPENLIRIDRGTPGWSSVKDIYICKETALAYNEMLKQAWKEDIFISVTHGYRSYEEQKELKKKFINQIGKQNAVKRVVPAGYSEHHTGWALDLAGMKKTDGTYITSNKEVYQWIEKNCYKYGFIIKNLKGKEDITGTIYEPWHIRYVGMSECSKVMSQKGLTLNEYLDMVNDNSLQCLYHGSNFDKVRDKYLTLKDICEICGVEISNVAMGDIDLNQIVEFSQIKMSKLKINRGDIFFCDQQVWEHISEKKADEIAINAFENGAKLLFSKRKIIDKNKTELPTIIVDNPLDCIIQIGKYIRNQYSVKTIGITGTCGKTTTKTLIYLALSSKFETHTNNANANDVNNVFDFITKLNETYEYYVQEVSGAGPGRVESSSEMLGLNASIVTNIGNYHLDLYKSIDNIAYDKLKIVENLAEDGIAILNFDDDILCNVKEKSSRKIIYISEFEEKADYYIKNSVQLTDGLVVNIIDNYTNIMPKEYSIKIDIIGRHNAFNIAAAFAIGQWAGIEEDVIIEGLQKYKSQGFRQVLKRIGDKQLYLDCFSLTEKSTITSIKTLVELPCDGKRIAVIGGAGHFGTELNATFARIAQEIKALPIDVLICFGDKTKQLYSGVKQYGKIETIFCSNMEDLIKCLQKVGDNDLILFKAVVSQCLPFAVDRVFGTDICINGGYYRQEHARRYRHKGYVYMIFECFNSRAASLDYYGGENDNIIIENEIDNTKITYINKNSFKEKYIRNVFMGENILGIGENAFRNCVLLQNIKFNKNLVYISTSAFENCYGVEKIVFQEGLTHIDDYAFKNCRNLKEVYIPYSVKYIGERAFEGCPNINFKYEKDSYAEKYAKKYKEQNEKSFINTARIFCLGNIRVGKKFNMQEFNEIKYFLTCGDFILGNLEIPKEEQNNKEKIEDYLMYLKGCNIGPLMVANESIGSLFNEIKEYNDIGNNFRPIKENIILLEIEGINIAVLNYMTFSTDKSKNLNVVYSKRRAESDVNSVKKLNVEFIIAYIHWGYRKSSDKDLSAGQKKVAQELADLGVDIIIGSHPEYVQPINIIKSEKKDNILCCYSLGDFYDVENSSISEMSIVISIIIKKIKGELFVKYGFIPVSTYKNNKKNSYNIVPLDKSIIRNVNFDRTINVKDKKVLEQIRKRVPEIKSVEEI